MTTEQLNEAKQLTQMLGELRRAMGEASMRRRVLVRELLASGMTMRRLGLELGISATEVHRLARSVSPRA